MVTVTLTPAQYAAKSAELKAKLGISLVGEKGTISAKGVTVDYQYDAQAGQLNCDIVDKPAFVPRKIAESQLKSWLTS